MCVVTVHQSPVSSQRHSPRDPFESAEATSPSSYCPDYTVRALTDLQLIRVCIYICVCVCVCVCVLVSDMSTVITVRYLMDNLATNDK